MRPNPHHGSCHTCLRLPNTIAPSRLLLTHVRHRLRDEREYPRCFNHAGLTSRSLRARWSSYATEPVVIGDRRRVELRWQQEPRTTAMGLGCVKTLTGHSLKQFCVV